MVAGSPRVWMRTRLTLMGLAIVAITSLAAIIGGYGIWSLGKEFRIYEDIAGEALTASEINADMAKTLLNAREYLGTRSPEDLVDTRKYLDETRVGIAKAQKEFRAADRRALVDDIAGALDQFEKGFDRLVFLLMERDRIVSQVMDPIGAEIRASFALVIDTGHTSRDFETAAIAGSIQQHLITARLYLAKYLLSNTREDAARVGSELLAVDQKIISLTTRLKANTSATTMPVDFDRVRALLDQYSAGFAALRALIQERNALRSAALDKGGAEINMWAARIKDSAVKSEHEVSARALNSVNRLETLVVIAGLLALLAGGLMAFFAARALSRQIVGITREMEALAAGDLNIQLASAARDDEIGLMARALMVFRDAAATKLILESESAAQHQIVEKTRAAAEQERTRNAEQHAKIAAEQAAFIGALGRELNKLAHGDLTSRLDAATSHAFGQIVTDFNETVKRLRGMMTTIVQSTVAVQGLTSEIASGVVDLSMRTEHQASALEQTSASMEQMSATVRQNAGNAQEASALAAGARMSAITGSQIVVHAISAIDKIEKSSREIGEIVGLIQEIAFQTNLLALNAAVEAARAGDSGRGFAVVANEVRALAQRAAQSSKDINRLIASSESQVREGVELVKQGGDALNEIVASVIKVADFVSEIASANREQTSGIDQVSMAVTDMDQLTQQNASLVEKTNAALMSARLQIDELRKAVASFKTGSEIDVIAAQPPPEIHQIVPVQQARAPRGRATARAVDSLSARDLEWKVF